MIGNAREVIGVSSIHSVYYIYQSEEDDLAICEHLDIRLSLTAL
jgi:hypothetical protein